MWKVLRVQTTNRFQSPLQRIADFASNRLHLENVEKIEPFYTAPWESPFDIRILDKGKATRDSLPLNTVFTAASLRKGVASFGIISPLRDKAVIIGKAG